MKLLWSRAWQKIKLRERTKKLKSKTEIKKEIVTDTYILTFKGRRLRLKQEGNMKEVEP